MDDLSPQSSRSWHRHIASVGLFALAWLVYANSLQGIFVLDDFPSFTQNPSIYTVWPVTDHLFNGRRGLVYLTFAINYAISGLDVWSWHVVNVTLHGLLAIALYHLLRALAKQPRVPQPVRDHHSHFALAATAIWVAHPLASQPVNYIVQRAEIMVSLFLVLTLLGLTRYATSNDRHRWLWAIVAIAACHLGMICKEVMFVTPLVALVLDWSLLAESTRQMLRKRWWLHLLLWLAIGWLFSAGLMHNLTPGAETDSAGLNTGLISPMGYLFNQSLVIWRYLAMVAWPFPQNFDWYAQPLPTDDPAVLIGVVSMGLLFAAACIALLKRSIYGWLGVAFFMVLGPTSSLVPVTDLMVEHRMYLPMALVIAIVVAGVIQAGHQLSMKLATDGKAMRRGGIAVAVVLVICLAGATMVRNRDYTSATRLWQSVVEVSPDNPRGQSQLAEALAGQGQFDQALVHAKQSFKAASRAAFSSSQLGVAFAQADKHPQGRYFLERAVRMDPQLGRAWLNLGSYFEKTGEIAAAEQALTRAMELTTLPGLPEYNLAVIKLRQGKVDEAIALLEIARGPLNADADVHAAISEAWRLKGDLAKAEVGYRQAIAMKPEDAGYHNTLGVILGSQGRFREAAQHFQVAVELEPSFEEAQRNLTKARAAAGE